jgi:DNA methylase
VNRQAKLKLIHSVDGLSDQDSPAVGGQPVDLLRRILAEGVLHGDAEQLLDQLPRGSVDLFFTSPPYADARAYSRIHPDRYVEWFLPFARSMYQATRPSGSLIINIKNRVASKGPLKGQRHPYVYQLVLALQNIGWRWIETYIWAKPNGVPGRFGPRTKDSFEYVYHFARGARPHFDLDAVRVPYKVDEAEISRRKRDTAGRRSTEAGFGRDRTKTYLLGGADPRNVVSGGVGRVLHQSCISGRGNCHRPLCRRCNHHRRGASIRPSLRWLRNTPAVRRGCAASDCGRRRRRHARRARQCTPGLESRYMLIVGTREATGDHHPAMSYTALSNALNSETA